VIVVDDHLIAIGLAAGTLESLSLSASLGDSGEFDGPVATTCSWWWRPCSALSGTRGGLNQLSAEVVVVAEVLGAAIVVGQDTPAVRGTARERRLAYRVL